MKNAFTLVELAIVLVIIGLLVGGVLAGQELIKQAQARKVYRQFEEFQTAQKTYFSKYARNPGDDNRAQRWFGGTCNWSKLDVGTTCPGDNDGKIDDNYISDRQWEQHTFWQHLSLAGLLPGTYSGVVYNTGCANPGFCERIGESIPAGPWEGTGWNVIYVQTGSWGWSAKPGDGNMYTLAYPEGGGAWGWWVLQNAGVFSGYEMAAFDLKYDDGKPNAGNIFVSNAFNNLCTVSNQGLVYSPYQTGKQCPPHFVAGF